MKRAKRVVFHKGVAFTKTPIHTAQKLVTAGRVHALFVAGAHVNDLNLFAGWHLACPISEEHFTTHTLKSIRNMWETYNYCAELGHCMFWVALKREGV